MVQVISNLGNTGSSFSAISVVRPVCVSIAFGAAVPLVARFVALPLTLWLNRHRTASKDGIVNRLLNQEIAPLVVHTAILLGLITATTYAGTSNLFAAYLAGASISWWDSSVPHLKPQQEGRIQSANDIPLRTSTDAAAPEQTGEQDGSQGTVILGGARPVPRTTSLVSVHERGMRGTDVFHRYYYQPLQRVLKPFFFASIGFSVPITRMFSGPVVWKGIVYTVLMFVSKFVCGFWLMRLPGLPSKILRFTKSSKDNASLAEKRANAEASRTGDAPEAVQRDQPSENTATAVSSKEDAPPQSNEGRAVASRSRSKVKIERSAPESTSKPLSLYPGCVLGCAMVARGEIGFLISALAESNGIYGDEAGGPIFLVVTWAIMLCTIIGPVLVGILVRRIKRMEGTSGGREGALGIWGVE